MYATLKLIFVYSIDVNTFLSVSRCRRIKHVGWKSLSRREITPSAF